MNDQPARDPPGRAFRVNPTQGSHTMKIDQSGIHTMHVSTLNPGDVFQFDDSFYIVTDSSASDQTCVDLETGHRVSDFSRDISDESVRLLPDAALSPHGLKSSKS